MLLPKMRSMRLAVPCLPTSAACISAWWLAWAGLLLSVRLGDGYECGGFISMSSSSSGTIQSPGYPGNYPNYTRCVWILQAPISHVPRLTVDFEGEMFDSACSDYVQFRDGGPSGDVILTNCITMTSEVVQASGRWMYVFFASDGFSQVDGLSAEYSAQYVGSAINDSISSPIDSCRSYEFECSNRLCISMSYRCDGYYDCGCGADCDEDGCGGLDIDKSTRMGLGLAVGVSVFILAAALGLLLEKRHNWEKERGPGDRSRDPQGRGRRHGGWASLGDNNKVGTSSSRPPSAACAIRVTEVV